jgi:hypothetical protein
LWHGVDGQRCLLQLKPDPLGGVRDGISLMLVKQSRSAYVIALLYGFHLLEEYAAPPGLWLWVETRFQIPFSHFHWLAVNIAFFALFLAAAHRLAKEAGPPWLTVAISVHLGLHAAMHLTHSILKSQYSPGLVTSLVFCLPTACALMPLALNSGSRRSILLGAVVGVATFPPLIHAAVLLAQGAAQ